MENVNLKKTVEQRLKEFILMKQAPIELLQTNEINDDDDMEGDYGQELPGKTNPE